MCICPTICRRLEIFHWWTHVFAGRVNLLGIYAKAIEVDNIYSLCTSYQESSTTISQRFTIPEYFYLFLSIIYAPIWSFSFFFLLQLTIEEQWAFCLSMTLQMNHHSTVSNKLVHLICWLRVEVPLVFVIESFLTNFQTLEIGFAT